MTVPDFVSLWNGARPALGSRLWGLGCWLLWQIQRRRPPSLAGAECWSSECWSSGYRRMTGSYTWVSCQALDLPVSLISPELCTGQGIGHQREATGLRGPDAPSELRPQQVYGPRPFLSPTLECRLPTECLDFVDVTCVLFFPLSAASLSCHTDFLLKFMSCVFGIFFSFVLCFRDFLKQWLKNIKCDYLKNCF